VAAGMALTPGVAEIGEGDTTSDDVVVSGVIFLAGGLGAKMN